MYDNAAHSAGSMTLRNSNKPGQNGDGQRHGSTESTGADSWRSADTVRGPFSSLRGSQGRGTQVKVNTNKNKRLQ